MPPLAPNLSAGGAVEVLALTGAAFIDAARRHGLSAPLALGHYRRAFRHGAAEAEWIGVPHMPVVAVRRDGPLVKFVQRVAGGLETESVIIPQSGRTGRPRTALCVSSQVGCGLRCAFCETAQMGLRRNLSTAEILGQWRAARFELGAKIDNVVFMGMGEPLDNARAVIEAIRVFADANGPAVAPSRIAVSTVGRLAGLARLADLAREEGFRRLRLAVSLNAPNDRIRSALMPVNRAVPMAALREAMLPWPGPPRARILIGYVLIPGVNDAPAHARELCAYLAPLACTVNLIPYNPRRDSPWPAPGEQAVRRFARQLRDGGCFVTRRRTLGRSVMAACGQLGNPTLRRRAPSGGGAHTLPPPR